MGMFDFMKFWKKKDDLEIPAMPADDPNLGMPGADMPGLEGAPPMPGAPGMEGPPPMPGMEPTTAMGPEQPPMFKPAEPLPATPAAQPAAQGQDMQLINAKLDAIKAGIDGLHQRMDKMELEKQKEEKEIVAWR
jgi:hypothetical protein